MKFIPFVSDLDAPLLNLSKLSLYRVKHSFGHIHFWGGSGSGKTSSAYVLADGYLRAGYAGYVSAVKPGTVPRGRGTDEKTNAKSSSSMKKKVSTS